MVLVPAGGGSEDGVMPSVELFDRMSRFNDELVSAGVMLAGEGLTPSSKGKRVRFEGSRRTVIDGPFTESKELIAGYWIWQVRDMDEAIEWIKRAPFDGGVVIELRPVADPEDLAEHLTPEIIERERRQDERMVELNAELNAERLAKN
jgi:hypothetical protein